jgi:hypothetical protein
VEKRGVIASVPDTDCRQPNDAGTKRTLRGRCVSKTAGPKGTILRAAGHDENPAHSILKGTAKRRCLCTKLQIPWVSFVIVSSSSLC